MTSWAAEELDRTAEELAIAVRGADGILASPVPIWAVRLGDRLHVRSWQGADGPWRRSAQRSRSARISARGVDLHETDPRVDDSIDAGYRAEHAGYPSYVPPMRGAQAPAATLELAPRRSARAGS